MSRSVQRPSERGVVIAWLALFLLMLLGFIAVGIDIAKLMATRAQLQNAADAAALAGASAVNPMTGTLNVSQAVARAQFAAQSNKAFINDDQPVMVGEDDVVVNASERTVKVTTRREGDNSVVAHFAQVLGIPSLQTMASATAHVDTALDVNCGIVPLAGVPLNPGEEFVIGQSYTLKVGPPSGLNGNFYALSFPSCDEGPCQGMSPTGAATYRCLLASGYCCKIEIGQVLNTEPGNLSGPTKTAIDERFDADKVKTQNISYADYLAAGGTGQRVVTVPITTPPSGGGRTTVTVTGFGSFFVRNRPTAGTSSDVVGEFIFNVRPGDIGGGGSGPVVFTIRLIE